MVAIGEIIEKIVREKRISIVEFAQSINTNRNNVYDIFKRKTLDTGLLEKISTVLQHDFFQYYKVEESELAIHSEPPNPYTKDVDMKRLSKKLEKLENQIKILTDRLNDKELIIELLKKKA